MVDIAKHKRNLLQIQMIPQMRYVHFPSISCISFPTPHRILSLHMYLICICKDSKWKVDRQSTRIRLCIWFDPPPLTFAVGNRMYSLIQSHEPFSTLFSHAYQNSRKANTCKIHIDTDTANVFDRKQDMYLMVTFLNYI